MKKLFLMPPLVAMLLTAGSFCVSAPAQYHEDNTWGFKIRVPKDWRKIPLKVNERWIIGKYQSEKSYISEESYPHKPEMKIIIFPDSRKNEKKRSARVADDGETVTFKQNFKDYKEYLDKNFRGGGWFLSKEKESTIAGIKVSQYEAKVEKLTYIGKQRIIGWVFHIPGGDLAVDFVVLENRYRKLKSLVYGTLKSFKLAERTGTAPGQGSGGASKKSTTKKKKWKDMTPLERMKSRKKKADEAAKRAIEALPDGWKHKKSDHFYILTHVDAKHTKRVINQAEAIRTWLDRNLFEIGEDYVPRIIIRICLDASERAGYYTGSSDSYTYSGSSEIVLAKKDVWSRKDEMETLSRGICQQYFWNKNSDLYWDMPPWIGRGVVQYVGTALCKGKKLVFKPDDWEKRQLREGKREDKLVKCQDLIKMTSEDYNKVARKSGQVTWSQTGSLYRHLMSSRCRKSKLTKNIIFTYFKHLKDVVTEVKKKDKKNRVRKAAKTAAEEREQRKSEQEAAKKRARYVVDETFKRTFGHWTDRNWAAFERGWAKENL